MANIAMVLKGDIRHDGRVRKEIATLVRAGHHLELVVSDFSKSGSGGEDLGVKIHYISMTLWSSPWRNFLEQLLFNRRAARLIKKLRPSHIHCHDLLALPAGVWAKRRIRARLVFDAHELIPEKSRGVKRTIWSHIEKTCVGNSDHIIMPERNRISYFKRKYPNIPEPLLLQNYPRKGEVPSERIDLFRSTYPIRKEQKIILYTGLIAPRRSVEELIEAMSICDERFVLVILGKAHKGYKEMLRVKVEKLGLSDRVFFHEAVPHTEILRYMASCDIGTAFYRNDNLNNYYCASNKLYEYIALDKAVLTNNYPGLQDAVGRFAQGLCLPEVTPKSLAEAYDRACDSHLVTPGARKFFWEDEQDILIGLYEDATLSESPVDSGVWREPGRSISSC